MSTKNNPGTFGCYERALPDEPMFVLLGRDQDAPYLVRLWATIRTGRIGQGVKPETDQIEVDEALECAAHMERWRKENDGIWRQDD